MPKIEPKQVSPLPVDLLLPEHVFLDNHTMFVTLRTLAELEQFWEAHESQFQFACEGIGLVYGPNFLRPYQWVFGSSKSAVVSSVMRWGRSGIGCRFYDWAQADPEEYRFYFHDREIYRASQMEKKQWTTEEEADYRKWTPATYRGWWRFSDLPSPYHPNEWFTPGVQTSELFDPDMPQVEVARVLHEETFEEWQIGGGEVQAYDRSGLIENIKYWQNERDSGASYYGDENEDAESPA